MTKVSKVEVAEALVETYEGDPAAFEDLLDGLRALGAEDLAARMERVDNDFDFWPLVQEAAALIRRLEREAFDKFMAEVPPGHPVETAPYFPASMWLREAGL